MEDQNLEPKAESKFQRQKKQIKELIIRHRDDFLTTLEKSWRDFLFRPLSLILYRLGITANVITFWGFGIIGLSMWAYFLKPDIYEQLIFLILGGLTDFIDGPTARNNNNITVLGTWLDHSRDFLLAGWATYLIYVYDLVGLELILIIWALQLILGWFILKDFLIRYLKGLTVDTATFDFNDFTSANLHTTVFGRAQFFFWIAGYAAFFASYIYSWPILGTAGGVLLILTIILATLEVFDIYKKIL